MYEISAVIVAAGGSKRFGRDKVFLKFSGRYIVEYSVDVFQNVEEIKEIILVTSKESFARAEELKEKYPKLKKIVEGGKDRQDSVSNGVSEASFPYVLIHDGARPSVSQDLVKRLIEGLSDSDAVVPVIPVRDTVVYFHEDCFQKSVPREGLFAIQTPQLYKKSILMEALKNATQKFTDESTLVFETLGIRAKGVRGSFENFKLTYPEDLLVFTKLLGGNMELRVGLGYDSHRLEVGRKLILGGVLVSEELGPVAHSDGDCLIHAIIDAILGCTGDRDIGVHYPDTDPRYAGISSMMLLEDVWRKVKSKVEIVNVDAVVRLEKPKLKDYIDEMKRNIATILQISVDQISIKAKTGEKIGPVGEGKLIECEAVVLARKLS